MPLKSLIHTLFHALNHALIQIPVFTLGLPLFLLYIYCQSFSSSDDLTLSLIHQTGQPLPVILEFHLYSNNPCHSSYAADCDQITLEFVTDKPCYFLLSSPLADRLSCPTQDFRHWLYVWQIQKNDLDDQEQLWATDIFNQLFPDGYLSYGLNRSITYFAPLELSYSLQLPKQSSVHTSVMPDTPVLTIYANHAVEFLPAEHFEQDGIPYQSITMIDEAGNGPLCILLPLKQELLATLPIIQDHASKANTESLIFYCIPLECIV